MKKRTPNQKGFTLPEVLLVLLIIGVISVLLTQLLTFNVSSSKAFSLYNTQQYTVQDAATRLNKDIEAATAVSLSDNISGNQYETINLTIDGATRSWKLSGGTLYMDSTAVVTGLTTESVFILKNNSLTVILEPVRTNSDKHPINVSQPIVSQYSLEYKT